MSHYYSDPSGGAWREFAACRGKPAAIFFVERGKPIDEARKLCASCPVADPCREFARTNGEHFGIWGGESERQRRRWRSLHSSIPDIESYSDPAKVVVSPPKARTRRSA